MKIKELDIKIFGPLKNRQYKLADGLNVFFGNNESGKTSIVDLIAKELFKVGRGSGTRNITPFKGVERYKSEEFNGSLTVEHNGQTYSNEKGAKKLKTEEILGDILISRLLCIESGDLTVPHDSNFYDTIKDSLSGTKGGIDKIKKVAFAQAGLPSSGENSKGSTFSNEQVKFKELLNKYKDLLPDLSKIHEIETSLFEVRGKITSIKESRLTTAKQDYEEFIKIKKNLESLKAVKEEDLKRIGKLIESKGKLATKKETRDKGIQDLSNKIVDDEMVYNEKRIKLKDMQERYASRLYLEFEEDFNRYVKSRDFSKRLEMFARPSYIGWIVSFITALFSLVYILISGAQTYIVPFSFAALGVVLFSFWKNFNSKEKEVETLKRRIKIQSTELKLPLAPDLENMDIDTLSKIKSEKDRLSGEVETLEKTLKKLKEEIPQKNIELKESSEGVEIIDKKIKEILDETGQTNVEIFEEKLKEKRDLDTALAKKKESLGILLGPDESLWEEVVNKVDSDRTEQTYDPRLFDELTKNENELSNKLQNIKKPFLQAGCESPHDIHKKIESCTTELDKLDLNLAAAKICQKIFTEIDVERSQVLSKVLEDKSSPVFSLTEKIIGEKRIKKILIENGNIKIQTMSDEKLDLETFSRGTHDQILFSFRLSLLKSIFKDVHFLILDDPFLTSDPSRREKLTDILHEFLKEGWQVLYFTFDPQVKELLSKNAKNVKVFELASLF